MTASATAAEVRPMRVVLAGAGGPVGRALAGLLPGRAVSSLTSQSCDLTSIPDTEVALAGAEVAVFLARAGRPSSRRYQASPEDVDLLLADTMARAAPRTSVRRLVLFACTADDPREAVLKASGLPVSVLRGGGEQPAAELAKLVEAKDAEERALANWWSGEALRSPSNDEVWSVQRQALPGGWTADDAAASYFEWLDRELPLVRVERNAGVFRVFLAGLPGLVLEHAKGQGRPESCVLLVAGGSFAKPRGRFEFRALATGGLMMALIGFRPTLPWPLYRMSQAIVHGSVVARFGQWLAAQPAK